MLTTQPILSPLRLCPLILIDSRIVGGPGKGIFQFIRHARTILGDRFSPTLARFSYDDLITDIAHQAHHECVPLVEIPCRGSFDSAALALGMATVRARGSTLIQSHGYKSHLYAWLIARRCRIPWLAFAHGWTREDRKTQLYHSLDRFLLPRADTVLTVSPPLYRTIARWRGRKRPTELVMNAVESEATGEPVPRTPLLPEFPHHQILIGCVGRMSPEKGQGVLLAAFREIAARRQDIHLVLIGDGPDREWLSGLATESLPPDRTTILPHQPNLDALFRALDIVVIPSLSEGLPNVLLEALAYRKPVVATTVGAIPDVVADGTSALLVAPGNSVALAAALERLLDSPALRQTIALGGHATLHPRFNPAARARKILESYERLAGQHFAPTFNNRNPDAQFTAEPHPIAPPA